MFRYFISILLSLMACNPSTEIPVDGGGPDRLTALSLRALALRDLRGTGRDFHDSVDSDVEQVLAEYDEPEIIERYCGQLEEIYFSRFEREHSPIQKLEVLNRLIGYCPGEDNLLQASQMVEIAAEAASVEGDPGRAVTLLQWLLSPTAELPEDRIPGIRLQIHQLLKPTVLANRQTRFERKFSAAWRENGWLSQDGEQVTVEMVFEESCVGVESYSVCEEQLFETARTGIVDILHQLGMAAFEMPEELTGEAQMPAYEMLQIESNSSRSTERVFQGRISLGQLMEEIYDWRGELESRGLNL